MSRISRRQFIKGSVLTVAALSGCQITGPAILKTRSPNSKINTACVAVGGRGGAHVGPAATENLVAICDVDRNTLAKVLKDHPNAKSFTDYRKMFDVMGKEIDAVFVATPDHTHTAATMLAIMSGKACYTEKPLTWDIEEAKALAKATAKMKVATQMGNGGHANQGNRLIVEWIRDGAVGEVQEVHTWTNRPIWPQGITERPPSKPVPESLDWDCWIGPAPYRDYHEGLHGFKWRGWQDFGCGAIGDMGCHTWDNVFWSMQPDYPEYVELLEINGPGGRETFPQQSKFKWVFPAKGKRPGFVAYWYSGGFKPQAPEELLNDPTRKQGDKKPEMPGSGNLYIGTKGKLLVTGDAGNSPRLIPEKSMQDFLEGRKDKISKNFIEPAPVPPEGKMSGQHYEFLLAARGEKPWNFPKTNFAEYAGALTEIMHIGAIAEKIGKVGFKIECDPKKRIVKTREALPYVSREYRKGWKL
ncbi:MAG: Gfo/Idh/MocA family oxidoreductase [Kiritimatiellae bacterium]|nr:Gfo/Idh/MocA family oxidoreductase [Kiritimatiellia bacterium]MDD5522726.1 Gfo/Idh/MocA family oxidoreductase [Kiritimatiellia bacterium]